MKEYFNFNLKAERLLSIWLAFLILFLAPYVVLIIKIKDFIDPHRLSTLLEFYGILVLLIVIAYSLIFYMVKLTIGGVVFKGTNFVFDRTFSQFMGKFLAGFILTVITFGIYYPWFITKMQKFFVDNTSHGSNKLEFAGTGWKLFKIMFFTTFLPILVLMVVMVYLQFKSGNSDPMTVRIYTNLVTVVCMIPFLYYFYKWMANVTFRAYTIRWETGFWKSTGKILLEVFLSIITAGIYYPYAGLRLYKYFIDRTYATSESSKKGFGYDLEGSKDFLFLWGQLLLTLITLGVYYPWACCKVCGRILSKTYVEEIVEEEIKPGESVTVTLSA